MLHHWACDGMRPKEGGGGAQRLLLIFQPSSTVQKLGVRCPGYLPCILGHMPRIPAVYDPGCLCATLPSPFQLMPQ